MSFEIDLRSDTLTQPTPAMKEAMMAAPLGDDVYEEDPTINALQQEAAAMFGKEAALFCPSGTMCNQIAIRVHTRPGDEVICDQWSHIYLYEGGGIAANSLSSVRLLAGDRGRLSAAQILKAINPDNVHFPRTSLVSLENTSNKGGGSCYDLKTLSEIRAVCDAHGLAMHLDGARLFNACVAMQYGPAEVGTFFDTISVCLSKGLGAPVGSILLGTQKHIDEAKRVRKMMGGGMRQAGILAAAGQYALHHHIARLEDDHRRAKTLETTLKNLSWVAAVMPVETNIVVFQPVAKFIDRDTLVHLLGERGIGLSSFGENYLRLVTHLDLDDAAISRVQEALYALPIVV